MLIKTQKIHSNANIYQQELINKRFNHSNALILLHFPDKHLTLVLSHAVNRNNFFISNIVCQMHNLQQNHDPISYSSMYTTVSAQKVSGQKVSGHKVSKSDMMCPKVSGEKSVKPKLYLLMNEIYLLISK